MQRLLVISGCIILLLSSIRTAQAKENNYVEIRRPFANVYEYLDPKSTILRQAKKGEVFELIYEGTSWYQIKIKEKVGWLEKRAGDVIDTPRFMFFSMSVGTFLVFLVLLIGTLGSVSYMIYKQKSNEL